MHQIKNYYMGSMHKINNGFQVEILNAHGQWTVQQFSSITLKFYHLEGRKYKLPQYVAKDLISVANGNGFIFLNDIEKENAIWQMKA